MTLARRTPFLLLLALAAAVALAVSLVAARPVIAPSAAAPAAPVPPPALVPLSVSVVPTGALSVPWDVVFAPDGTMVFNQRGGGITARPPGQAQRVLTKTTDFPALDVRGELGLLGMALDPQFGAADGQHRILYTCESTRVGTRSFDQVRRWQINTTWTRATRLSTILPDAPAGDGGAIHAGCRVLFDKTGALMVSVGDAAVGTYPEDPAVLAGKVLRINTDGTAAAGNPTTGGDARVWTRGHRNPQGLALRPGTNQVWEAEHGPDRDDEVNLLTRGADFGWNPVGAGGGYDQSVPMTAKGATKAKFSTGTPTLALAGATFLSGSQWGSLDGALVVATLKASKLLVFALDGRRLSVPAVPPELNGTYGRLRAVRQGTDGALYVTTSNGSNDKVLRVAPAAATATAG